MYFENPDTKYVGDDYEDDFSINLVDDTDDMLIFKNDVLTNTENYGSYAPLAYGGNVFINTANINKFNWQSHYDSVLNLFKDGIEVKFIQKGFITLSFSNGYTVELALTDYLINLIMWNMLIRTDTVIEPKHIFFDNEIKKDTIKVYIDKFLIDTNRKRFTNKELNNIIDDTLYRIHDIDIFAMFLANTVNLEDNIFLMQRCEEFNDCMHVSVENVPIEDIKSIGMQYANKSIEIIKNAKQYLGYDHCLADAFRASEGINPKQYKEFAINIGTKPDGHAGIFPYGINQSFINGGVSTPLDYFIESSTGRTAQIIKFNNVGSSGHFARLLGLNNMDSNLYQDPNYDCHCQNFLEVFIKDKKTLKMFNNRYYRLAPNGVEKLVTTSSTELVGRKIYVRSPITCASASRGQGICYKCYGDLAYTVYDAGINFGVNIGRIASETLSSSLTQKLLSAKHLLETFAEKIVWSYKFNELFEVEGNTIRINSELEVKDFKLTIDPEGIELENEEDDDLNYSDDDENSGIPIYNEYIVEFDVLENNGEVHHISNDKNAKLYISNEFNSVIRRKGEPIDGKIYIDFAEMKDITLFIVPIENNELSKTLEHLQNLLNKNITIKGMNIHQLIQALIDTIIEGGLNIASTHLEVIISNQVKDANDILERPKWSMYDPDYEILSLNRALTCNPSISVSMSYQKVSKLLYNPLTYRKKGSSFMDLFFMEKPQYTINGIDEPTDEEFKPTPGEFYEPMIFSEDPDKVTEVKSDK